MKKLLLLILLGICLFTNICFAENKEQNATNSNIATSSYVEKVLTKKYKSPLNEQIVTLTTLKLIKISDKVITINGIDYNKYKYEAEVTTNYESDYDYTFFVGFEDKQETFSCGGLFGSGVTLIPANINLDDLRV